MLEQNNFSESNFLSLNDEQLLNHIKNGNNAALEHLINKYKNFVCSKAKTYFLVGADKEDIIQEGMIGLFKAIRDFKDDKLVSFKSFAEICVTRQIITAVKTATRQKHMPLNSLAIVTAHQVRSKPYYHHCRYKQFYVLSVPYFCWKNALL